MELKLRARDFDERFKTFSTRVAKYCANSMFDADRDDLENQMLRTPASVSFEIIDDYQDEGFDKFQKSIKVVMPTFQLRGRTCIAAGSEDCEESIYLDKHAAGAIRDFMQSFINQVEAQEVKS